MTAKRLYVEHDLFAGVALTLDGDSAHYIGRVMRARPGDTLMLFNGDGGQWQARIDNITRGEVALSVIGAVAGIAEPRLRICLWQALSRNEKMDLAVQKAVELGATGIRPVIVERSVMRLDDQRRARREAHWHSVAVNAAQQCGRCSVPVVHATTTLAAALSERAPDDPGILALPDAALSLADALASVEASGGLDLLIGPEGGLTEAETALAVAGGFTACRAGPRVLRTETAAIALLAVLQYALGDMHGGR